MSKWKVIYDPTLTQQGVILGTPGYMSPEQAKGDIKNIGPGSDIYSLGVVFYEMLTGKRPFVSGTPFGVIHKHINEPPTPLRKLDASIPVGFEKVIMRCLEKKPEQRYQSAFAVKEDLEKFSCLPKGYYPGKPAPAIMQEKIRPRSYSKTKGLTKVVLVMEVLKQRFHKAKAWTQPLKRPESIRKLKKKLARLKENQKSKKELKRKKQLVVSQIEGMIFIKGGCFLMGDTFGDGSSDEKPVHKACVEDFYLGEHELTQGEWKDVMGENPSAFKTCGDDWPMENVSWNDVRAFIRKLNIKTGTNYRIPTEAEWEYAAREGGKHVKWAGKSSRSKLDKYAWYASNSNQKTHPVKTKKPNSFGLYDMSGNVWEWVFGWYGEKYYNNPSLNNPGAPGQGNPRLFVEAHGLNFPNDLRAAYRFWYPPDSRYSLIGLRFARDKN